MVEHVGLGGLEGEREVLQAVGDEVEPQQLGGQEQQRPAQAMAIGIIVTVPTPVESRKKVTLRTLSKVTRPSSTAAWMLTKLSSASTMSAASRATSVPALPMATPMSAVRSASASLTPSPVTATTSPAALAASTMRSLWVGEVRANTATRPTTSRQPRVGEPVEVVAGQHGGVVGVDDADLAGDRGGGGGVVAGDHDHALPGLAAAVDRLGHAGRGGSSMPCSPRNTSPSGSVSASVVGIGDVRVAAHREGHHPQPLAGHAVHLASTRSGSRSTPPAAAWHIASTRSGAPLTKTRCSSPCARMRMLAE
jgi:hypothetical protein